MLRSDTITLYVAPKNGDPGRPGARFRLTDWVVGVEYFSGLDANDVFYDITIYQNEFYLCTKHHISTALTPAQCVAQGLDLWEIALNWKFVATDLLMSRKIRADEIDVDNLTVKNVEVRDSQGNVTTSIDGETGNLYSKKATFENANVQGKVTTSIAGVRIELDPTTNSLKMYANGDAEVCVINFISDGTLSIPKIQLRNASKVGNNVTYTRETLFRAGYISINEDMSGHSYMMVLNTDGLSFYKDGTQTKKYASI